MTGRTAGTRRALGIAIVGAGELASALAAGLSRPVAVSDHGSGRAARLAATCGGTCGPNDVIAREAIVFLAHPVQALHDVARDLDGRAACVISLLSGVDTATVRGAYRRSPVVRVTVTVTAALRRGVVTWPRARDLPPALDHAIAELLGSIGTLIELDEAAMTALITLAGVAPAYYAMILEAQTAAAVAVGVPPDVAQRAALISAEASIELLRFRGGDIAAVRRSVTTPGGRTERGLAALRAGGVAAAFEDAARAVLAGGRA